MPVNASGGAIGILPPLIACLGEPYRDMHCRQRALAPARVRAPLITQASRALWQTHRNLSCRQRGFGLRNTGLTEMEDGRRQDGAGMALGHALDKIIQ